MVSQPQDLFEDIANDIVGALETVVHDFAEEIREKISIPVEREGNKIIRSKKGEYPRRDKGTLYAGMKSDIKRTGEIVEAKVYNETSYAGDLEDMDRKLLTDSTEAFEARCLDAVMRAVESEGA